MQFDYLYQAPHVNRRESKRAAWALFLIGAFSVTQVKFGFAIGISEIFVYIAAPFLFVRNLAMLRKHGLLFIICLGIAVNVGCVLSGLINGIPAFWICKGLASTYPLFAFPVVLHHYLQKDLRNLKWLLLGVAVTFVINIFAFRTSFEETTFTQGASGAGAISAIMSGPIFWIGRSSRFINWPIDGFYLQTPTMYSVFAPIAFAAFSILTSESGRSSALGSFGAAAIAFLCGKNRVRMRRFQRFFCVYMVIAVLGVLVFHAIYRMAAKSGILGEKALVKYEVQSGGSNSVLKLLMGGRAEFFIGLSAALDKPLFGHGPWAVDTQGYRREFLMRYGTEEDYKRIAERDRYQQQFGVEERIGYIPSHSHLISFWLWFGLVGLLYWLYVLYAIFRYLAKELTAIPQWVGFLAVGAPTMLWNLFFSGLGYRICTLPYVVALIIAHSVATGKMKISYEMEIEALKAEHKL